VFEATLWAVIGMNRAARRLAHRHGRAA